MGTFLTSPAPPFPVVYGWQVHHGGEETREHSRRLGPLVPLVPLLQDLWGRSPECREALQQPRVSPAKNVCILPWAPGDLASVTSVTPSLLREIKRAPKGIPKSHRSWGENGFVLFCLILAWHWILTETLINKLIPSLGETSKFLLKVQSKWKPLRDYKIKSF